MFNRMETKKQDACKVFALCTNQATTTISNPIKGKVPACQRCKDKMDRIGGK